MDPTVVALGIRDLKFRYEAAARGRPERGDGAPDREWIVDVPALDLLPGEQMLLTGSSGRGKSTLLHLIAGLMEPTRGRVFVGGADVHALRGAARDLYRGRRIGMIFQTFNLLHGFSTLENVMVALMFSQIPRREHRVCAERLLRHLGLDAPERGIDRLSLGQQQRVAVARAVACNPILVLADEPTASLDPENAAVAVELIQSICREKNAALLCVSHDPSMAERFERRASLDELAEAVAR